LALLRTGFTKPLQSPAALVSSYLTVSPLPARSFLLTGGLLSVALIPDLAIGRRYRPSCPVKPGLSSRGFSTSDHQADSFMHKDISASVRAVKYRRAQGVVLLTEFVNLFCSWGPSWDWKIIPLVKPGFPGLELITFPGSIETFAEIFVPSF
jgi:hypothetical protein